MVLFLGHFSFDEVDSEENPRHGYFSAVAEADNADAAMDKFKALIKNKKKKGGIFEKVLAVYIDDIIEIPSVTEKGFITTFQSSDGAFPESVSHSLPDVETEEIKAYGYAIDLKQFEQKPVHQYKEKTPFLDFHKFETPAEK